MGGVVAAGDPRTAQAGADVLAAGGNAVDAAVCAAGVSFSAESSLTGLGGGGYMLVAPAGGEPVLLDFFVEVSGRGAAPERAELLPVSISFGEAVQAFHVGAASIGTFGVPAGLCEAARRFGSMPMSELLAPGVAAAREGVPITAEQAYIIGILQPIYDTTPECRALYEPEGTPLLEGEPFRYPELGDALERLGREGDRPFYEGEVAEAILAHLQSTGATLTREDLAAYEVVAREPVRARYRGRDVLTNPPPSAGGILIAYALSLLERGEGPATPERIVAVMEAAQAERTPDFLEGLSDPGFVEHFRASRMGSTTHISVLDERGNACGVTCSNGEGSAILVPGTGVHLNNMLGEQDLNPLGFHRHPPGRRLPSMMAPTVVMRDGAVELVLGSGGSNRIRSAIMQTIVNLVDREMPVDDAVRAPRLHFEDGVVYAEPGIDLDEVERTGHTVARFRDLNMFFGGVQAVQGSPPAGGGDPRRGGAVVAV